MTSLQSLSDVQTLLLKLVKDAAVQDTDAVVSLATIPRKDLKGFDSLTEVELLTDFEEQTGIHFDEDIFKAPNKKRRNIGEIAEAMWQSLLPKGAQSGKLV